ncbi:porin [Paraburkholderia caffeinilytica]|uniref:porin n=1 Tax=Paraburkholderia caffeinilytica TaxID=1761016 RepID=UPI003DA090BA
MKKSIFALAVMSAFSGAVHAQSSVTLYGVIDEGLVYQSNAKTGGANTAANPNTGGKRFYLDSIAGLYGSRWGLKGSEDLGGGLAAVFLLENGFNVNNGALGQNGLEFGRQAYVGVSSDYGTVTLGRQYDTLFDFIGPLIFADQIGTGASTLPGDVDNTQNAQRINNSIKYKSPNFKGLTANAMYSFGGVPGSFARNQVYSLGVSYANGPVRLAAALDHANQPNTSFFSNSALSSGALAAGGQSISASNNPVYGGYINANSYQSLAAGGSYAIGPVKIGVVYSNVKFQNLQSGLSGLPTSTTGPQGTAVFNSVELNLIWRLTPALQVGGAYSYMHGSNVRFGSVLAPTRTHDTGGANYNEVSLAADYFLSVRTDVYIAAVYQTASGVDSTGTRATALIYAATASPNNHDALVRLGLRHRF